MSDSPKYVTYRDFSGGEFGEIGEFRAAPNQYTGVNVVLYDNGMLGPRAGLHENTYTGTMQGNVYGMFHIGAIGKPLMIVADDKVFASTENNFSLGTVTQVATLNDTPVSPISATWYDPNGDIYFTSPGDLSYYLNWTSDTLSNFELGGFPMSGTNVAYLCRDRLYLAGDSFGGDLGQTVWVSAAADFTNLDDGETFEVGYYNSIRAVVESQDSLMFSTLESANFLGSSVGWYSLVGATPQGSLRRVNTQLGTENHQGVVNAEGGNIYFWGGFSTFDSDNPYLVSTNGAKFDEDSYQHLRLQGQARFGYYNAPDKSLLYVSDEGNNGLMRVNGAWSRVNFEVDVSGPVAPTSRGDSFLLAHGATGEDVKVYELLTSPTQPGVAGGNQNPGDASNTPINAFFSMPAFMSDTKEFRVRRVIVDFMKWNTVHDDINNEFTVGVRTWGQYNLPGGSTDGDVSTSQEWSENQDLSATDGTMDRFVARIGQQGWSAGFRIFILGMKGVAIESITVEYDEQPVTGRTK